MKFVLPEQLDHDLREKRNNTHLQPHFHIAIPDCRRLFIAGSQLIFSMKFHIYRHLFMPCRGHKANRNLFFLPEYQESRKQSKRYLHEYEKPNI